MVALVGFVSLSVSIALVWLAAVVSYFAEVGWQGRPPIEWFLLVMGILLPFLLILIGLMFVYLAFEQQKNRLIFKDWIASLKKDFVSYEEKVHAMIGQQLQDELRDTDTFELPFEEPTSVVNISKTDPITKYKDLELPDDVDLHFVDKEKA